jgi:uncharacterized protein YaaN involved in tellurite resistance
MQTPESYTEKTQKFVTAVDIILTRIYKSEDKMTFKAKEREVTDEYERVYDDICDYILNLRQMYDAQTAVFK